MMRTQIYATAVSLAITLFNLPAYSNQVLKSLEVPSIVKTDQFPRTRGRQVRHTFFVHIPQQSSALSQLIITVPAGLKVRDDIRVFTEKGSTISTNLSINDRQIIVNFSQPIARATTIKIVMNNVKISGVSNAWLYYFNAKLMGEQATFPIGVASVRSYY